MSSSPQITVLVTAVGGGAVGEQLLKALRLAPTDYRIVGADISRASKGLGELDQCVILPRATDADYINTALDTCKRVGAQALLCGSEPELCVLANHRDTFAAAGIFLPVNPPHVIDIAMDKVKTMAFLGNNGFKTPAFFRVTDERDIRKVDVFPCVLKPSVGSGGSANVHIAQTPMELQTLGMMLLDSHPEFIVQEYVGTPDREYTVGILHTMDGTFINSIAVKRQIMSSLSNRIKVANKTGRAELGKVLAISSGISQGHIGRYPEVVSVCERVASALKAQAAINIQCRIHHGDVYVFEINPRFSGTTSLRAMVGYNEPDVLVRHHLLGEPFERRFAYDEGLILRGLSETLMPDRDD